MDATLMVAGILCMLVGFIGCVVPVLPGPVLAYCGLLLQLFSSHPPSWTLLLTCGAVVLAAIVLDYIVPALGAKKFHCSTWGVVGCTLGTIVGIFFVPWGIVMGPFLGAVVGELIGGKQLHESLKGGFGAFLGFGAGLLIKLGVCVFLTLMLFRR